MRSRRTWRALSRLSACGSVCAMCHLLGRVAPGPPGALACAGPDRPHLPDVQRCQLDTTTTYEEIDTEAIDPRRIDPARDAGPAVRKYLYHGTIEEDVQLQRLTARKLERSPLDIPVDAVADHRALSINGQALADAVVDDQCLLCAIRRAAQFDAKLVGIARFDLRDDLKRIAL